MPDHFTLDSVIQEGWRCSQPLRRFLESELGKSFHFSKAVRDFIAADGVGQPLEDLAEVWRADRAAGPRPIDAQFEYNRHTREYRAERPGGTAQEVREAWWEKTGRRPHKGPSGSRKR